MELKNFFSHLQDGLEVECVLIPEGSTANTLRVDTSRLYIGLLLLFNRKNGFEKKSQDS